MNPILRVIYWTYRLTSTSRYWARRRLTMPGWMVLGSLIVAVLMGVDIENTVAYQIFPTLLFLLALAIICSWFFRARFSATRLLPRFGTVGQPFYYRTMLKNLTSKTQAGLVLLEDLADPRPSYREWRAVQLADERRIRSFQLNRQRRINLFRLARVKPAEVPPVRPGEEVEVRVEVTPLRRGILQFTGVTLARTDPVGLFRSMVNTPVSQAVLVLPKRYLLPRIALPGTMKYQEGGVALASSIGRSDEFVSLRDYRRGDPYRHIHWRSWAKAGKPIVKEFEDEFFVRHALVLDTFISDPRSEAFEEAVSIAASFACSLPSQESLLDLLFAGEQAYCFTAGRGLAHADQMLEILASVHPYTDQPFSKLETLVLEHTPVVSGCICVLLSWDEVRRRMVEKMMMLSVPMLVIIVVEAGQKKNFDPGPMRDFPEHFHVVEAGRIEEGLLRLKV